MYEGDQQASSLWTFVVAVLQAVLPYGHAPRRTAALGRLLRSDWSDQDGLPSWNSKMDTVSNRGPPESTDASAITKSPAASILPGVSVGSWGKAPSRLVGKGVSRFQREVPRTVAAHRGQIPPPMGEPGDDKRAERVARRLHDKEARALVASVVRPHGMDLVCIG